jgi:uncharacterized membrane protein
MVKKEARYPLPFFHPQLKPISSMKNHLPVVLIVLAVAFLLLALPAQSFMAGRGASQTVLDLTFGSCLVLSGLCIGATFVALIPWESFKFQWKK